MKLIDLHEGTFQYVRSENIYNVLTSKCPNALEAFKKGKKIFRGSNSVEARVYLSSGKRHGAQWLDTNFFYNVLPLFDTWKKVPDRTKSFDMSTDSVYAGDYGQLHYVFPFDGSTLAYAKGADDFWNIFEPNLSELFDLMMAWIRRYAESQGKSKAEGRLVANDFFMPHDKLIDPQTSRKSLEELVDLISPEDYNRLMDTINKAGQRVVTTTDVASLPKGVEVWSEGPLLIVSIDEFDEHIRDRI